MRTGNNVGCDGQVVIDEFSRIIHVGPNTAHLCSCEEDVFGLFRFKKGLYFRLPPQIQFRVGSGDEIYVAFGMEAAENGGTDEASVASDVYFGGFLQNRYLLLVTCYSGKKIMSYSLYVIGSLLGISWLFLLTLSKFCLSQISNVAIQ